MNFNYLRSDKCKKIYSPSKKIRKKHYENERKVFTILSLPFYLVLFFPHKYIYRCSRKIPFATNFIFEKSFIGLFNPLR